MTPHVVEELPDLALGALDVSRRDVVEAHLADCPDCAGAFYDLRELLGLFAEALPAAPPSPGLRGRVIADARGRLARFVPVVAEMLQLDEAHAQAELDRLDEPDPFLLEPMPGTRGHLVSFEGGVLRGFILVPAGAQVARHTHEGRERTYVLQGALLDDTGRLYQPGEMMTMASGTTHTFCAFGDEDCICCVELEGGYSLVA